MGLQGNIQQGRHGGFAHMQTWQVSARKILPEFCMKINEIVRLILMTAG
jgi:hypothetical protein